VSIPAEYERVESATISLLTEDGTDDGRRLTCPRAVCGQHVEADLRQKPLRIGRLDGLDERLFTYLETRKVWSVLAGSSLPTLAGLPVVVS
jgi:hypothetical protein